MRSGCFQWPVGGRCQSIGSKMKSGENCASLALSLEDGHAEYMGDGMFVVEQTIAGGRPGSSQRHRVTLSVHDLERMMATAG
jgi:hypothetical protein